MTFLCEASDRLDTPLQPNWSVILALFAVEGSIGLALLALYKKGAQSFASFMYTNAGLALAFSLTVLLVSAAWIARTYVRADRAGLRVFRLTVAMNVITVVSILLCGEMTIRLLAKQAVQGETIHGMLLLPKNWLKTRNHYRALWGKVSGTHLEQADASTSSYVVYDPDLGWAIGPNRRSTNGLYFSDAQSLRAPNVGEDVLVPPRAPWIATLGDSFTFGEEVAYHDTWPAQLEHLFEGRFAVANFGVLGYGVDQSYLRYVRDVRHRRPAIAILGFISNDLFRSMTVYTFLSFPEWESPFSKPRFLLTDGRLRLINAPTISPDAIFAKSAITDLPYLQYDMGYTPLEWQRDWYHASYFARFLATRFPRWIPENANAAEEAVFALNERILRSFVELARESGTRPVIAYFPTAGDFHPERPNVTGKTFLQRTGLPYLDPTPCLLQVPESERFEPGGHYSPRGNAAVAHCLARSLRNLLASPEVQERSRTVVDRSN
jgi:hypothetical protein